MRSQADFPYQFDSAACASCGGRCCRGEGGYVWVSWPEIETMAASCGLSAEIFAKHYARRVMGRLSLQERSLGGEHLCCFFDPASCRCLIYDHRPEQCRTFPFWNRFKADIRELLRECPGIVPSSRAD